MKLLRFGPAGAERPGVLVPGQDGDRAYDVSGLVTDFDPGFWRQGGPARLIDAVTAGRLPEVDLAGTRLGPPVGRPPKIVCIGLNYHDHATEAGMQLPAEPVVFMKAPYTVVGPDDDVLIPPGSAKTDWEVELAVVINRTARYLPDVAAAREVIGGYALSDDLSEREYQLERGGQWDKGKSCETFNPLGPWLVTPDEIGDPGALRLRMEVNGALMQDGSTADMIFGIDYLVWYLSQFMVLEPGDVINTGTPAGVGMGQRPPRYLRPGDTMTLSIDGLGSQHHTCRAADPAAPPSLAADLGLIQPGLPQLGPEEVQDRRGAADGPLFSPAVRAGDLLFVSGQASVNPDGTIVSGSFAEEMHRSIENVRRILAGHGRGLSDVVKVGAYVHDPADLAEFNRLYRDYFPAPRPARTTITGCLTDAIKFELDVVAYAPPQSGSG